jgi:hypothetical protein
MWNETIAGACGRGAAVCRALAARVFTGRAAFLIAAVIDLLVVLWRLRAGPRSGRSF